MDRHSIIRKCSLLRIHPARITALLVFTLMSIGLWAQALPPDIQADQYLLAAKKQLEAENYAGAAEYFEKILALGVKVPTEFYYHYGKTLLKTQKYEASKSALTKYVTQEGRAGKYYTQALELLTEAEEKETAMKTAAATAAKTAAKSADQSKYTIGGRGPAGGTIFYDKGEYSGGWRFLEAWSTDEGVFKWKTNCTSSSGTATGIGTGQANTRSLAGTDHPAAEACRRAVHGGYNDWFLPSKDELSLMYGKIDLSGGDYWSSSEAGTSYAWYQWFPRPGVYAARKKPPDFGDKDCNGNVRAIRAF